VGMLEPAPELTALIEAWMFLFFFITLKPRVELYTKCMSLKYEPSSEPLHIFDPKPQTRAGGST